jgi:hypothetical protein
MDFIIIVVPIIIFFWIFYLLKKDMERTERYYRRLIWKKINHMKTIGDEEDQFEKHVSWIRTFIHKYNFSAKDFGIDTASEIEFLEKTYYKACAKRLIRGFAIECPGRDETDYRRYKELVGFINKIGYRPITEEIGFDKKELHGLCAKIIKSIAQGYIANIAAMLDENELTFPDIGMEIKEGTIAKALERTNF